MKNKKTLTDAEWLKGIEQNDSESKQAINKKQEEKRHRIWKYLNQRPKHLEE